MSDLKIDVQNLGLHLPNAHNCLQSAKSELQKKQPDMALVCRYLESAQGSISQVLSWRRAS